MTIGLTAILPRIGVAQGTPRPRAPSTSSASVARSASDSLARLHGTVYDSTADRPLANATVQLLRVGTETSDTRTIAADTAGRWVSPPLAPGTWAVAFAHPALDLYGVEMPVRAIEVQPGDSAFLPLGFPSTRGMWRVLCASANASDSTSALVGLVREADTGPDEGGVAGARVIIQWREMEIIGGVRVVRRQARATTDAGGSYRACGVPSGVVLSVRAERVTEAQPTLVSGDMDVELVPYSVARRDLLVSPAPVAVAATSASASAEGSAGGARGPARLTGVVKDASGRPLSGARVVVLGTGREATTNSAGFFTLDSLPSGSRMVEGRALGFSPVRGAVTLSRAEPAAVTLQFMAVVASLDRVTVLGKRSARSQLLDDLADRKQRTAGYMFMPVDINRINPAFTSDLLRRVPGFRLTPTRFGRQRVTARGGCTPTIFVDGAVLSGAADELDQLVPLQDILAVEVYASFAGVPAALQSGTQTNPCGVIGIWTKR